jgi:PIN domain-containing protein
LRPRSSTNDRPPDPIFFVDRNLGPGFVSHLRVNGLRVEHHDDHFPATTLDIEWLAWVGERGWVAISQDQFRADPEEQEQLMLNGVKTFVLLGQGTQLELAQCFLRKIRRIRQLIAANPGPFIAKIHLATGEVRIAMTLEQWFTHQARRKR